MVRIFRSKKRPVRPNAEEIRERRIYLAGLPRNEWAWVTARERDELIRKGATVVESWEAEGAT